jgi:hypothetical protein
MAAGGSVAFDVEAWPLVIMTCGGNMEGTVGPIRAFFETAHAREEPFAIMVDTRPVRSMPGPKWRRELTDWTGDPVVQLNSAQYNVATAVVLSSALARGVYTALGWLWKPASPVKACATPAEAVDWCCDLLMKAKVPRSPKLIELQRSFHESGGARHPSARQSR